MFKTLTLPLLASAFIHGLIIAVVLIGMPSASPQISRPPPSFIKAELVTIDKPKPKPKKKPAPVKNNKINSKPTDNSTKLAAKEKARQLQLAKQREKEQQLAKERAEKAQAEQERREREQALREQELLEQQQREELERELADAIAQEAAQQQAESDIELAGSITALISERITQNWSRPPSARNNMEAELVLNLVPTGEVVSVSVAKSSGNSAFDRSAEQAVMRAQPFRELQKLPGRVFEKNFRRFRLKFRPEDLRL